MTLYYSKRQQDYMKKEEKRIYSPSNVLKLLSEVSPNGAEEVIEEADPTASSSNFPTSQ
jgi:hypothetical protein